MKLVPFILAMALLLSACSNNTNELNEPVAKGWKTVFFDDFDTFNTDNWRDQILWVNDEDQCYVTDGQYNTREVSDGSLKLRVVDLGEKLSCDNINKAGKQHFDT